VPSAPFLPVMGTGINVPGPEAVWPSKLLPEASTERLFLGNDLHHGENDREQRWNEPRAGTAESDRPPDQQ